MKIMIYDKYLPSGYQSLKKHLKVLIRRQKVKIFNLLYSPSKYKSSKIKFVFIVGVGHSGNTLLAALLSRHPKVYCINKESNVFMPGKTRRNSLEILKNWENSALKNGNQVIVEKTPKHCLCIEQIFATISKPKILFIIRDGRDVVCSLNKRFQNAKLSSLRYKIDNQAVLNSRYYSKVLTVRYEDLVLKTADTIKAICSFLEIEYDEIMLQSSTSSFDLNDVSILDKNFAHRATRYQQVSKPISSESIGRYKKDLSQFQLDAFMKLNADVMSTLGYQ